MAIKKQEAQKAPTQEEKIFAALGYVWILCFVPLLLKQDSKFAMFHGKQGLMLFIIEIIGTIVFWIPVIGWLLGLLVLILAILGIIKSLQGEYYEVPIAHTLVEKLNL